MSESITSTFAQMKVMAEKINERRKQVSDLFYEVFDDDSDIALMDRVNSDPMGDYDDFFNMDMEEDTVNYFPISLLDRSDDDLRVMWEVLKWDLSINAFAELIKYTEGVMAQAQSDYDLSSDAEKANAVDILRKNTDERKQYVEEAKKTRDDLMKTVEDADALSRHFLR